MPFTVTHVAAVLPIAWLLSWRVPFSALAVGSMVCDLGVFFPEYFDYFVMHSPRGLFTHCLPYGLLLYFAYQFFLKRAFIALLPRVFSERLGKYANQRLSLRATSMIVVCVCIILGAATHVLWDSFTHGGRWGTRVFPVLNEIVIDAQQRPVRWYSILQHGSSVVLLPPMLLGSLLWLLRQPRRPEENAPQTKLMVKVIGGLCLVLVPVLCYAYYWLRYPDVPQYTIIHFAVKLACTLLILLAGLYGIMYAIVDRQRTQAEF